MDSYVNTENHPKELTKKDKLIQWIDELNEEYVKIWVDIKVQGCTCQMVLPRLRSRH